MSSLLQPARSDEQLTAAIATGDADAFDELYRRYARPLAAYGARVLRDRSRGEDVAQTALARAYEALRRGTEPLRVKPWLYKIALNTALEQRAKDGEVLDGESDAHEDVAQSASTQRADILAAVQVLPERQRMVFFLREVQGLSVADVAQRLGLDNQQVEQALFAARNRLAEELVFGTRVDCNLVRSLDSRSLTRFERRALKGHMRSCPSCRHNSAFGLTSMSLWIRNAWQWFAGGGGGAVASAAKVGALAVTAAAIGTAPVTLPVIARKLPVIAHKLPLIAHKVTDHAHMPLAAAPPAGVPEALKRLGKLNALFVPPFARPLVPPFEAPDAAQPGPDSLAALPNAEPNSTAQQNAITSATADQTPQVQADNAPADSTPVDASTDSTTDASTTDASGTDGTDSSSSDPNTTDTTATDTTSTDATATDTGADDTTATDTTATDTTGADTGANDTTPTDTTPTDTTPTDTTP